MFWENEDTIYLTWITIYDTFFHFFLLSDHKPYNIHGRSILRTRFRWRSRPTFCYRCLRNGKQQPTTDSIKLDRWSNFIYMGLRGRIKLHHIGQGSKWQRGEFAGLRWGQYRGWIIYVTIPALDTRSKISKLVIHNCWMFISSYGDRIINYHYCGHKK